MNVELLRKVEAHILEEPLRYNQNITAITTDAKIIKEYNNAVPPCGTAACIGGWAYLLGGGKLANRAHTLEQAARFLAIDSDESSRLFSYVDSASDMYSAGWPPEFNRQYLAATTPLERAKIAAARIEHFIATDGAE